MTFTQLQCNRPILAQIGMRAPEKPECGAQHRRPDPWNECGKEVIGEREPRCKQINNRQKEASRKDADEEKSLPPIRSTDRAFKVFRPRLIHATNDHVDYEAGEKDDVPWLNSHRSIYDIVSLHFRRCKVNPPATSSHAAQSPPPAPSRWYPCSHPTTPPASRARRCR